MTSNIANIIVSLDFSGAALNAINTAIHMCKRHGATLHILYLTDAGGVFPTEGQLMPIASFNRELFESDLELVRDFAEAIRDQHRISCNYYHQIGFEVRTLSEKALELSCDLIVVPTDIPRKSKWFPIGGQTYQLLKQAHCPVLAVPVERKLDSFRNIIFPIRAKKEIGEKYSFSKAILLRNKADVSIIGLLDSREGSRSKAIREMLDNTKRWMKSDGIAHTAGVVYHPDPAKGLIQTGSTYDTDLVIINASTKNNLCQNVFGSYTKKMTRAYEFAVLFFIQQQKSSKVAVQGEEIYPLIFAN